MMFLALFSSFFRWLWLCRVRALNVALDPPQHFVVTEAPKQNDEGGLCVLV